jgi:hypothetical protein
MFVPGGATAAVAKQLQGNSGTHPVHPDSNLLQMLA